MQWRTRVPPDAIIGAYRSVCLDRFLQPAAQTGKALAVDEVGFAGVLRRATHGFQRVAKRLDCCRQVVRSADARRLWGRPNALCTLVNRSARLRADSDRTRICSRMCAPLMSKAFNDLIIAMTASLLMKTPCTISTLLQVWVTLQAIKAG